ncbi:hypothetical protein R9X47_06790 [Wukongibacter baidiensis]|uniref:hypothetical protein n=1 Tax=Wukongibacter baidiensis TaxID=1723361 RepID=UPI003D7F313E
MKKKRFSRSLVIAFTTAALIGSISIVSGAVFMEPGSEEDPIVTLSYVEKRLEQLKYYINQNIETLGNGTPEVDTKIDSINSQLQELKTKVDNLSPNQNSSNVTESGTAGKFKVVFIEEGKSVYLGESAEVIWRSGKSTVIASKQGGLSDLTIGKDLQSDEEVPLNHLILIPRNDGRGMRSTTDSYVMIKGEYTIK